MDTNEKAGYNLSVRRSYQLASGERVDMNAIEAKKLDRPEGSVSVVVSANLFHLLLSCFEHINGSN